MSSKPLSRWSLSLLVLLCPVFMNFDGCSPKITTTGPPPPPGGFSVQILDQNRNGTTAVHSGGTVSGNWVRDPNPNTSTVGSLESFGVNPQPFSVVGGRAPATWSGTWNPLDDNCLDRINFPNGATWSGSMALHLGNTVAICNTPPLGGAFVFSNSLPSTLTATGTGFSNGGGMPQLSLFDGSLSAVKQVAASSVAADGTTATFPFPTNADGSPLTFGHYSYNVANATGSGPSKVGVGVLSVATNATYSGTPFGIDAVDIATTYVQCPIGGSCSTFVSNGPGPLITFAGLNKVVLGSPNIPSDAVTVGTTPVAVKAYGVTTVNTSGTFTIFGIPEWTWTETITGPHYALVANYGSNSVSRIDLLSLNTVGTFNLLNTITVGSQPVALAIKPDNTKAYVANYGSASISEIDLASQTQTRVLSVGTSPLSLSIDSSGSTLWVGGLNYITKVDLASFTASSTFTVSGQVGSVAVASTQNALVYTAVSTGTSTFQAQNASISTGTPMQTFVSASTTGTAFASGTPGYLLSGVSAVSSNFNNRYALTSTPTGFELIDLQTQTVIMDGTTPSAIRGMAIDPSGQMIYLTAPESNSVISIPAPPPNAPQVISNIGSKHSGSGANC
ncbi:MAG TPA: hypothetical protein VGK22_13765 [Candidatus Angelobacter sp.]|jgi:YVTN family beta-propeller protein